MRAHGSEEQNAALAHDRRLLMGQNAGAIKSIRTAQQIVDDMVAQAHSEITKMQTFLRSKL